MTFQQFMKSRLIIPRQHSLYRATTSSTVTASAAIHHSSPVVNWISKATSFSTDNNAIIPSPPSSTYSIPTFDLGYDVPSSSSTTTTTSRSLRKSSDSAVLPAATISQIGTTRRVSILKPIFNNEEMMGLAHRIDILGRNKSCSGILLVGGRYGGEVNTGNDANNDGGCEKERRRDWQRARRQKKASGNNNLVVNVLDHDDDDDDLYDDDELGINNSISTVNSSHTNYNANNLLLPDAALEMINNIPYDPFDEDNVNCGNIVSYGCDHRSLQKMSKEERWNVLTSLGDLTLSCRGSKMMNAAAAATMNNGNDNKEMKDNSKNNEDLDDLEYNPYRHTSLIPTISIPDGPITDGGYAIATTTHVLATHRTTYSIRNPRRGLSFDPIGSSFLLPRLLHDYHAHNDRIYATNNNDSTRRMNAVRRRKYQSELSMSIGLILALTSTVASGNDMVESGLATHYTLSDPDIPSIERSLAESIPSYEHQTIKQGGRLPSRPYRGGILGEYDTKKSKTYGPGLVPGNMTWEFYDDDGNYLKPPNTFPDIDAEIKNEAVSALLEACCDYDSNAFDSPPPPPSSSSTSDSSGNNSNSDNINPFAEDPSLYWGDGTDVGEMYGERNSVLIDYAILLKDNFIGTGGLLGVYERLRATSLGLSTNDNDPDQDNDNSQAVAIEAAAAEAAVTNRTKERKQNAARILLEGIEKSSPLALHATYELVKRGSKIGETMERCMTREAKVMMNILEKNDYQSWCHRSSGSSSTTTATNNTSRGEGDENNEEGLVVGKWSHKNIAEVTEQEVNELFQ